MSGIKSVGKDCIPNKPTVCQSGIKTFPTKKEFLIRASIIAMVTSPSNTTKGGVKMSDKQRSGFVSQFVSPINKKGKKLMLRGDVRTGKKRCY